MSESTESFATIYSGYLSQGDTPLYYNIKKIDGITEQEMGQKLWRQKRNQGKKPEISQIRIKAKV